LERSLLFQRGTDRFSTAATTLVSGPILTTGALQQVLSYRTYTGDRTDPVATAAYEPEPTLVVVIRPGWSATSLKKND
jgi:hypothetical protein